MRGERAGRDPADQGAEPPKWSPASSLGSGSPGADRKPYRPGRASSGRSERSDQLSSHHAPSWGGSSARHLPAGSSGRSHEKLRWSGDGTGSLMPIVQRSAQMAESGARPFLSARGLPASPHPATPAAAFRVHAAAAACARDSPGATQRPRVSQLMLDVLETDSPKGMDRALTPSLLKAVRMSSSPAAACRAKTPGNVSVFQASFSKQRASPGSAAEQPCYEDLAAAFAEGSPRRSSPGGTASQSAASSPGPQQDWAGASGRKLLRSFPGACREPGGSIRAAGVLETLPSVGAAEQGREDAGRRTGAAEPSGETAEDSVQRLMRLRLLQNIATPPPSTAAEPPAGLPSKKQPRLIRCNITRISRRSLLGVASPAAFELYSMKGRLKLLAERDGSSSSFLLTSSGIGPKRQLEASLQPSTFAENQWLLIGSEPGTPAAACNPDQDPVILAVAFGRSPAGQRTAAVLLPDTRAGGGCDLGSKQYIAAHFQQLLGSGHAPKDTRVLRSVPGKELAGARFVRGSVKNMQLQLAEEHEGGWPGTTPRAADTPDAAPKKGGRVVFEFGRLRHDHEFVCDYESPTLSAVQALGLAVACSAPKRAFLYL